MKVIEGFVFLVAVVASGAIIILAGSCIAAILFEDEFKEYCKKRKNTDEESGGLDSSESEKVQVIWHCITNDQNQTEAELKAHFLQIIDPDDAYGSNLKLKIVALEVIRDSGVKELHLSLGDDQIGHNHIANWTPITDGNVLGVGGAFVEWSRELAKHQVQGRSDSLGKGLDPKTTKIVEKGLMIYLRDVGKEG
jgi:hypothetical protein